MLLKQENNEIQSRECVYVCKRKEDSRIYTNYL